MLFIKPMWDSEIQRLGKIKCSPLAYYLHVYSELIGFLAFILLLVLLGAMFLFRIDFSYWWYSLPFIIGILTDIVFHYSWGIVEEKEFKYDNEKREVTWIEDGELVTFHYDSE